jgi:cytosine deaminase
MTPKAGLPVADVARTRLQGIGDELALEATTYGGLRLLGLEPFGLAAGAPADLVVVSAQTPAEAVVARLARHLVLKGGRMVRDGHIVR